MSTKKRRTVKTKKKSSATTKKAKADAADLPDESAIDKLDLTRAGMPARDSIIGVKEFHKGARTYRLIETNEVDEYEEPPKSKRKKSKT